MYSCHYLAVFKGRVLYLFSVIIAQFEVLPFQICRKSCVLHFFLNFQAIELVDRLQLLLSSLHVVAVDEHRLVLLMGSNERGGTLDLSVGAVGTGAACRLLEFVSRSQSHVAKDSVHLARRPLVIDLQELPGANLIC